MIELFLIALCTLVLVLYLQARAETRQKRRQHNQPDPATRSQHLLTPRV